MNDIMFLEDFKTRMVPIGIDDVILGEEVTILDYPVRHYWTQEVDQHLLDELYRISEDRYRIYVPAGDTRDRTYPPGTTVHFRKHNCPYVAMMHSDDQWHSPYGPVAREHMTDVEVLFRGSMMSGLAMDEELIDWS